MSRLHSGETATASSLLNLFIRHQHGHRHMAFSITISTQEYFKIRGRLEKIVKNAGHVVGMPLDNFIFKTSTQKETVQKTNANIKWPYTTKWDYFDSKHSNRSGRFSLPRTNTNHYKALFYPRLCRFLMKFIPVIKLSVCMRQDVCF